MAPAPALVDRFRTDLHALTPPGGPIGVAVSGGPDSLALLLLAAAGHDGMIEAATLDHGLRHDSLAEARLVAKICEGLDLRHEVLAPSRTPEGNVQGWARAVRYEALQDWATRRSLVAVATAHHAHDQAETVLMRLARGSGVGGLAGIQRSRAIAPGSPIGLLRPLLGWRRDELRAIVAAAGMEPADDPSNRDERFDRTRVRDLLARTPWLEPARLAASATNLGDAEEALDWMAREQFRARSAWDGAVLTLRAAGLPRELRFRLLVLGLCALGADEPRGPKLAAAVDALEMGETRTLGGVKIAGGSAWRLELATPRGASPSARAG